MKDKYQEVAREAYMKAANPSAAGGSSKRKQHASLEEKVNSLYTNIKLYEKSIKLISGKCTKFS